MFTKISSGLQAIFMATEQLWQDLRNYCEDNMAILCRMYGMWFITHPRNKKILDLQEWAHEDCYDTSADVMQ